MEEALRKVVGDETCPSSRIRVSLSRVQDGAILEGVGKDHFEAIHRLLESTTSWTRYSLDWEEKVDYKAAAGSDDTSQDPVTVSYGERDPMNVRCDREIIVGLPVFMSTTSSLQEELLLRTERVKRREASPPNSRSRYTTVCMQKFREFTRTSSSVETVSTTFRLTVQWRAHCLRDAYTAAPAYIIEVMMDRKMDEISDDKTFVQPSVESELALHKWMTANLRAKVGDICLSKDLELTQEPTRAEARSSGERKGKKRRKLSSGGENSELEMDQDDMELTSEAGHEDDDEGQECFDDQDDEDCADDYM